MNIFRTIFIISSVYTVVCQVNVDVALSLYDATDNLLGPNVMTVEENTRVRFKCDYTFLAAPTTGFFVTLRTYAIGSDNPTNQFRCVFDSITDEEPLNMGGIGNIPNKTFDSDFTKCKPRVTADLKLTENTPHRFDCQVIDFAEKGNASREHVLRTHVTPTQPIITVPTASLKEGSSLEFQCSSTARPPPKLRFNLLGSDVTDGDPNTTHVPLISTINDDSNSDTSVLTWTTTATANMNSATLRCEVYDHPSGSQKFEDEKLAVIYGPVSRPASQISWNLYTEPEKTLTCSLSSNPDPDYKWYNGSVGSTELGTGDKLVLQRKDFTYVAIGKRFVQNYYCQGTNAQNDNEQGQTMFTIAITNLDITTTTTVSTSTTKFFATGSINDGGTGGGNSGSSKGLTDGWTWQYALIAIGALALIILIIVAVVFCIKRRNNSSPAKIKKAAAKNSGTNNDNSTNYQNTSTTGQPDIIRATPVSSYQSPAHQPSNRYSQPNVEDYADAFDHAPRSRKPIALDDLSLDPYAPPASEMGPPAYHDTYTENNSYMRSPHDSYTMSYGAAC